MMQKKIEGMKKRRQATKNIERVIKSMQLWQNNTLVISIT